jgi:hypothetical protein
MAASRLNSTPKRVGMGKPPNQLSEPPARAYPSGEYNPEYVKGYFIVPVVLALLFFNFKVLSSPRARDGGRCLSKGGFVCDFVFRCGSSALSLAGRVRWRRWW